jgi:hypothetical protein
LPHNGGYSIDDIITDNVISGFNVGMSCSSFSGMIMRNLLINNNYGLKWYANAETTKTTIQNNTIANNSYGVYLDVATVSDACYPTISYNNIQNNSAQNIVIGYYIDEPQVFNANNNWWGTTDTSVISQTFSIREKLQDAERLTNKVDFMPCLPSPNTEATPNSNSDSMPAPTITNTPSPAATNQINTNVTPSPTVPEFPTIVILPLIAAAMIGVLVFRKRTNAMMH